MWQPQLLYLLLLEVLQPAKNLKYQSYRRKNFLQTMSVWLEY